MYVQRFFPRFDVNSTKNNRNANVMAMGKLSQPVVCNNLGLRAITLCGKVKTCSLIWSDILQLEVFEAVLAKELESIHAHTRILTHTYSFRPHSSTPVFQGLQEFLQSISFWFSVRETSLLPTFSPFFYSFIRFSTHVY